MASCQSPGCEDAGKRTLSLRIVACLVDMAASVSRSRALLAFLPSVVTFKRRVHAVFPIIAFPECFVIRITWRSSTAPAAGDILRLQRDATASGLKICHEEWALFRPHVYARRREGPRQRRFDRARRHLS